MEPAMKNGVKLHVIVIDSIQAQLREVRALVNAHALPKTLLWSLLGSKNAPVQQQKQRNRVPEDVKDHIATFNTVQAQVLVCVLSSGNSICRCSCIDSAALEASYGPHVDVLILSLSLPVHTHAGDV